MLLIRLHSTISKMAISSSCGRFAQAHPTCAIFRGLHQAKMEPGDPFTTSPLPKLLLLGDSLTQYGYSADGGWVSIVADRLQRRCDVISRGYSGYNTRLIRHYFSTIFDPLEDFDFCGVVVFIGANDSVVGGPQHVPLLEYERNLLAITKSLQQRYRKLGPNRFVIVSPPPIDEKMCTERCRIIYNVPLNRFNHVLKSYASVCKSVSEKLSTSFVDFFHIASEAGAARCLNDKPANGEMAHFFTDSIHFGPLASKMLADAVWPEINKFTKDFRPFLPNWRDIDLSSIAFDD